ncbi:MAG: hypothetical protein K8U03_12845 [Planctomycetia bacterium]|nr:hypothetical protein [Planctomycetia bacterium]
MRNVFQRSIVFTALVALGATGFAKPFEKATHGKIELKSVDVLGFGPDGVLLIGDGAGASIYAVQTSEGKPTAQLSGTHAGINKKLAAAIGAKPDGIEILDLAVNPISGTVYFAVRKQDDKLPIVLTVNAAGEVGLFAMDSVEYARVQLPTKNSPIKKVSDVAWVDDKLIASAGAAEEFASKIFIVKTPLSHDAAGELHSAETYHVAHGKWETKAPMSTIMPFQEDGKTYVAGAFACTPVVKYPIDALEPNAHVKGTSVIELGSGNRPLDMFTYSKDGKEYVLSNTFRFHHAKSPVGPSPYWTVKFERGLLDEEKNVNEKAVRRLSKDDPTAQKITVVDAFHGVTQMDRLGEKDVVVLRENADKTLDLAVLALP